MNDFLAFALFAFVASITPGPTNVLVLAHSARHGFMASLPIVLGACTAAAGIVWLVGLGLGDWLTARPAVARVMGWAGIAWLAWLAWRLFASAAADPRAEAAKPAARLGIGGAAALQLVNPKVWMMALAVVGVFAVGDGSTGERVARLAILFLLISLPCMALWAGLGAGAARVIRSAGALRRFNQAMALLLLLSAWLSRPG